jgi:hypothetical protein
MREVWDTLTDPSGGLLRLRPHTVGVTIPPSLSPPGFNGQATHLVFHELRLLPA